MRKSVKGKEKKERFLYEIFPDLNHQEIQKIFSQTNKDFEKALQLCLVRVKAQSDDDFVGQVFEQSEGISQGAYQAECQGISKEISKDISEGISEGTSEGTSEETSEGTSEGLPLTRARAPFSRDTDTRLTPQMLRDINEICAMFPQMARESVEDAIGVYRGDADAAVSWLVSLGNPLKDPLKEESVSKQKQIELLLQVFPNATKKQCEQALEKSNGLVDAAAAALAQEGQSVWDGRTLLENLSPIRPSISIRETLLETLSLRPSTVRETPIRASRVRDTPRNDQAQGNGETEVIDLHGLTVAEARVYLDIVCETFNSAWLHVITGKGLHSPDGRARLAGAARKFFENRGWIIKERNGDGGSFWTRPR